MYFTRHALTALIVTDMRGIANPTPATDESATSNYSPIASSPTHGLTIIDFAIAFPSSATHTMPTPPQDTFKACHQVLNTPELCLEILENVDMWGLATAAQAGGPFLRAIYGSAALRKQLCLRYDDEPFDDPTFNHYLY